MAKKPGTNPKGEFAFFNVFYEDDSQRSNRRVPSELLGGLDGDEPARAFIQEQDREIAEKSGRPALEIKRIERVGGEKEVGRRRPRQKQERRGCGPQFSFGWMRGQPLKQYKNGELSPAVHCLRDQSQPRIQRL